MTVPLAVKVAAFVLSVVQTQVGRLARAREQACNARLLQGCPPRDGDADVRKDRGAAFEIMFSIRDASSKRSNAPAELLESTLTPREDHVSSVHAPIQTRAHAGKISDIVKRKPTQEQWLPQSPSHAHKLKNNSATQLTYRRADPNHSCPAHCEQLLASFVLLVPEVFYWRSSENTPSTDLFSARKRFFFFEAWNTICPHVRFESVW